MKKQRKKSMNRKEKKRRKKARDKYTFKDNFLPIEYFGYKTGTLVKIRPCEPAYADKTYLGILLGQLPCGVMGLYDIKTDITEFRAHYNPAIFVPELKKIIFGFESWWGPIDNEAELKEITNDDISNVWYVKALKAMAKESEVKDASKE